MSGRVDGVYYHNLDELAEARRKKREREARERAVYHADENRRLHRELDQKRNEFNSVRGDIQRMEAKSNEIEANTRQIAHNQQQFENSQRQVNQQVQQDMQCLQEHARQTDEKITDIQQEQQRFQQVVDKEFDNVRSEMEQGFALAEQRRQETEQTLRNEIQQVDEKLDQEINDRLQRIQNQIDRATTAIQIAEEHISNVDDKTIAMLDLERDFSDFRSNIATARQEIARGEEQSLSLSLECLKHAKSIQHEARRRQQKIEHNRDYLLKWADSIEMMLQGDLIDTYFVLEKKQLLEFLSNQKAKIVQELDRYANIEIKIDKFTTQLSKMESFARHIQSNAPVVQMASLERKQKLKEFIPNVVKVYGDLEDIKQSYANPEDKKSDLIVEMDFGGRKATLLFDLEGEFHQPITNEDSSNSCSNRMSAIIQQVKNTSMITNTEFDHARLNEQSPAREQRANTWSSISSDLNKLKDHL